MCRSASKRVATYSRVIPCSVPFRHRSGFTTKTLTHHQQPYVVKLVFLAPCVADSRVVLPAYVARRPASLFVSLLRCSLPSLSIYDKKDRTSKSFLIYESPEP